MSVWVLSGHWGVTVNWQWSVFQCRVPWMLGGSGEVVLTGAVSVGHCRILSHLDSENMLEQRSRHSFRPMPDLCPTVLQCI